uniref:RING-type domain-containing protein n=1 Tax=Paramoeba aestuarina TaxID=180227 RepID=A0A7S4KLC9_9EUKA
MYDDEPGVLKVYEGEDYVRIPMKALNSDFSCPVCLGIIKSAMVVTQCMHRFCEECISNSLRLGNKECPKCRAKCASKRHLRPDHAFDKLLLSVIKDVDKFEDEQLKLVKQVTASAKVTGNSALISEGIIKQSKNRGKRLTKHDIDSAALLPSSSSSSLPPLRATPSEKNKPTKKRERTTRAKSIESTPERVPFEPPPPKKVKKTPKEKKTPDPILDPVPDGGEKGPVCWTYYQHNKVKDSIIVQRPVPNASPLITIYLQRHPESKLPILERPWLTLPKSVQIDVLKNFVHKKHRINSPLTFFSPLSS